MTSRFTINKLALAVTLSAAASAQAQDLAIEEVIVTAQKREQSIQEVPVSVAAISGDKIAEAGMTNLEDLSSYVPNLNITMANRGQIMMRGLGSGYNEGFEQSVGMYVDGVYYGRDRQYRGGLVDLERVEVLRGSQGILFGKNTIAGAINITTARPTQDFEAKISGTYGDYNERELTGVISGGITDSVAGRLVVSGYQRDGYMENRIDGGLDGDELDNRTVRGSLAWQINDNWEVLAKAEQGRYETNGSTVQLSQAGALGGLYSAYDPALETDFDLDYAIDHPQKMRTDTDNVTLTTTGDLGGLTFTSVTALSGFESVDDINADYGLLPLTFQGTGQDFSQYSQEFRIASPGGETIDYIAGVYWQSAELDYYDQTAIDLGVFTASDIMVASRRSFSQQSDSWAIFAETTWNATEQFALTGGVRYTSESKDAHAMLIPVEVEGSAGEATTRFVAENSFGYSFFDETASREESKVTPMLKAQYFINEDVMAYATASKGFKGGGFNMQLTNHNTQPFEFEEENSTTYEMGVKSTLLDGAMHLNAALFNTSFEDLQVTSYDGFFFVVGNAAEATSQGLELDATWRATERLTLGANYAWLDAQYDDFAGGSCPVGAATAVCDLSGQTLVYAPENSANLNISYVMPLGADYELEFAGDINYTDDFYFQQDLDPEEFQKGFTKVNGRVALNNIASDWRLALVGKNLTDKLTSSYGLDQPVLNGGAHVRNTLPPRTLALQFDINF